ncbi:hypothetical protein [Vibrio parahaemolyticus]|uniref:hypothetical protein n=1 Tax=Vibrio parahaemolyticus TaxID=670 RepID=UPI00387AEAD5
MDLTTSQSITTGKAIFEFMCDSYQKRQKRRVETFLKYVNLRYEDASPENVEQLNGYIKSEEGQEVLASFADSITQTSCKRVHMSLAILFCKDPDHDFSENETYTFVSAMIGMNNALLDFFLEVCNLPRDVNVSPYPRSCIGHQDAGAFAKKGWDEEAIFVYINDLIRLRLILPDPSTHGVVFGNNEGWAL